MFEIIRKNEKLPDKEKFNLDNRGFLDEKTLFHRLTVDFIWIVEHDNFQKPQSIMPFNERFYGVLKSGQDYLMFLNSS